MTREAIGQDVYRVVLGCDSRTRLLHAFCEDAINNQREPRCMVRDDGSLVHVLHVFVDRAGLQSLVRRGELMLMQIDNLTARRRAVTALRYADPTSRYPLAQAA